MIIQCEKCHTRFTINETLLKHEGSTVRCSRCKHAFVAFPPEQPEAEEQPAIIVIKGLEETLEKTADAGLEEERDIEEISQEEVIEAIGKLEPECHEDVGVGAKAEDEPKYGTETIKAVSEKKKSERTKPFVISLVIFFILLGIAYAVVNLFHWLPDFLTVPTTKQDDEQKSGDQGASRLEILTVNGSFVDSEKAGRFFVIRGKVRNGYPMSRDFILIKGSILDDKGQVVKEKTAYAGNVFGEKALPKLPLDKISRAMENRPGLFNKNLGVIPGATIDFMIVFEDLPANMTEFTVAAISSSPGVSSSATPNYRYCNIPKKDGSYETTRCYDLEELCKDYIFYRKKILQANQENDTNKLNEYKTNCSKLTNG